MERSASSAITEILESIFIFKVPERNQSTASVVDRMDPLQCAYRAKRGVEDATLTFPDRILSMDLSSAFNTSQSHLLIKRPKRSMVPASPIVIAILYESNTEGTNFRIMFVCFTFCSLSSS